MRIRKVNEPFKHLSGEPAKTITVKPEKKIFSEPATVTDITKAAGYNSANKKVANS